MPAPIFTLPVANGEVDRNAFNAEVNRCLASLYATATGGVPDPDPATPDEAVNALILSHSPQFLLGGITGAQWNDISGNNRHATIVGTQGTRLTEGPGGMPFFMGTTTCHAEMPHDNAYNSAERTALFWFSITDSGSSTASGLHRGGDEKLSAVGNERTVLSYWNGSASLNKTVGTIITDSEWAFVAHTYSGGQSRVYLGVGGTLTLEGTVAVSTPISTSEKTGINARIVGSTVDRRNNFGYSKVARMAKALTLAELQAIYNASKG